jgi:hypothetical protein
MITVVIGLAMVLPVDQAAADSQGMPSTIGVATNLPSVINVATVSNQTSVIPIRQGKGMALTRIFNSSSSTNTGNVTMWMWPTADGTNYETVKPWIWVVPANGTNTVVATTNWSIAALAGYSGLNFGTISNATGVGIVTNLGVI